MDDLDLKLLGIGKLCEVLDVSDRTVSRMVKRGELPAPVWVGGERRWFLRDIREYLEKLRHDPKKGRGDSQTNADRGRQGRTNS